MTEFFCDSAEDYDQHPFPLTGGDTYEERGMTDEPHADEGYIYYVRPQESLRAGDSLEVDLALATVLTHVADTVESLPY